MPINPSVEKLFTEYDKSFAINGTTNSNTKFEARGTGLRSFTIG